MHRIYVDSNIFIGAFNVGNQLSRDIIETLGHFEVLPNVLVTSELTLAEFGAKDLKSSRDARTLPILGIFIDFVAVSQSILLETCQYRIDLRRSGRQMKLPDAIHCVTAIQSKCDVVFSGDKRLWLPTGIERVEPNATGFAKMRGFLNV